MVHGEGPCNYPTLSENQLSYELDMETFYLHDLTQLYSKLLMLKSTENKCKTLLVFT